MWEDEGEEEEERERWGREKQSGEEEGVRG